MAPSVFAALEDEMSALCDQTFGEQFEYRPYLEGPGGGRGGADGSRPVVTITGVFSDKSYEAKSFGEVERTSSRMTLRHAKLSIDRRLIDAPRRSDRVKRIDTAAVYEIAEINEDGEGRWKFRLIELGKETP
jgi:hypothetical protein